MQIKPHDKGDTYLIVAFRAGSLAAIRDNEAERGTHDIATMRFVAPMMQQCVNAKCGTHVWHPSHLGTHEINKCGSVYVAPMGR